MTAHQFVLDILKDLRTRVEIDPRSSELAAICTTVFGVERSLYVSYHAVDNLLRRLFESWPEFSGRVAYPVPHPTGGRTDSIFYLAAAHNLMWIGEYGASRKRLLNYMIERLESAVYVN